VERIALAGLPLLFVAGAAAQQAGAPGPPRFEVVSIRPIAPNTQILREQGFTPIKPGGQYMDDGTNLLFMLSFAYDVQDPSIRLVGIPAAANKTYSIRAKPAAGFPLHPPAENKEQVRLMLRAMLEDRFHLKLHTEMREGQIYSLRVAKGGFKFKEVDPPIPPERAGYTNAAMGDQGGRIIGTKTTMADMARMLVVFLKRPVADETGLKGYYSFDVKWDEPTLPDGQRAASGFGAAGSGLLVSTLQDRFGLRLASSTGPVKYWVVDHAEAPDED
jgi:uncharacterized protein (TIGR03435 family)